MSQSERGGTVGAQSKFWFMVNATLITAYTGAVGPLFGLGLPMTLIVIVAGTIFGTLFQAFHGAQGPHMGLPQMIQSRVQFGSRGAVVPIAVAAIVPIGFAIFFLQTGGDAAATLIPGSVSIFEVLIGVLAGLLAIVGYRLILQSEGIIAYVMLANLVALSASTGCSRVAIHLDVDAIDSDEVILGLGIEPGGLTTTQVRRLIGDIDAAAEIVGFTIAEFIPRQVMQLQRLVSGLPLI